MLKGNRKCTFTCSVNHVRNVEKKIMFIVLELDCFLKNERGENWRSTRVDSCARRHCMSCNRTHTGAEHGLSPSSTHNFSSVHCGMGDGDVLRVSGRLQTADSGASGRLMHSNVGQLSDEVGLEIRATKIFEPSYRFRIKCTVKIKHDKRIDGRNINHVEEIL